MRRTESTLEASKSADSACSLVPIKKKGSGIRATFTVRRISYGEGVERTFLLHSPFIKKIEVKKKGAVRRAKLYYLREKKGKKSKVAEKIKQETLEKSAENPSENASAAGEANLPDQQV